MNARALLLPFALGLCCGCAEVGVPGFEPEPEIPRTLPAPSVDAYTPTEGSLWRGDVSRRFLAFENRAKQIGDLVTVVISERAQAENSATTDLERTSEFSATLDSDVQLQTLITRPIRNFLWLLGFTNDRAERDPGVELNILDAQTESTFEGEGTTERESRFTTTIACVVSGVTPSGLLHIVGERHLRINEETQIIRLDGYVRPEDIQIDNTVASSLIANAAIEFGGHGVIAEKQKAPWLARIFEFLLPF